MTDAKGLSERYPYYQCEINECARFLDEKDRADALAERLKAEEDEVELKSACIAGQRKQIDQLTADLKDCEAAYHKVGEYNDKLKADLARVTQERDALKADKEWFEDFACSCNVPDYICQAHSERDETNTSTFKDRLAFHAAQNTRLKAAIEGLLNGAIDMGTHFHLPSWAVKKCQAALTEAT